VPVQVAPVARLESRAPREHWARGFAVRCRGAREAAPLVALCGLLTGRVLGDERVVRERAGRARVLVLFCEGDDEAWCDVFLVDRGHGLCGRWDRLRPMRKRLPIGIGVDVVNRRDRRCGQEGCVRDKLVAAI